MDARCNRRALSAMRVVCAAFALVGMVALAPHARAQQSGTQAPDATEKPSSAAPSVDFLPDLVYGRAGGEDLKLDLARPKDGKGPFPAVVCIHGGGWAHGSRKMYGGLIRQLARAGYVGATVDYRLAPKHLFPACVEDVKCAVRWLRANAEKYAIDPDRVGAWGDSAGGHLVGMLGTTSREDGLEGNGGSPEQSSRVQAVVAFYGPFDMTAGHAADPAAPDLSSYRLRLIEQFLGGPPSQVPDVYRKASPMTYVSKDDPPFLLIHGTQDKLVPIGQSEAFEKKLKEAGVEAELMRIEGGDHGFGGRNLETALAAALAFFEKHLKPAASKRP